MSLLDVFTGGKSDEASDALRRAEAYYANIQTPTKQDLTLPELQKYVEAGVITPAQAQAYLQQSNAYNDMNVDQKGTNAEITALNQLAQVAGAGEQGTPSAQAAMDLAEQNMNRSVGGQRGAIEQAMAAKGTPYALIQAALANQTVGQEGQQAHMDAVNAQAAAYQAALEAMAQGGALGGQLQNQQNTQANTVAAAQNAMQQFNAANQQNVSEANAGRTQEANMSNLANKQQVSNNNVGLANSRTQYNAQIPQQMFENSMNKASGMAGAATNYGNLEQKQGQQAAGINSGLLNLATSFIPKSSGSPTNQTQVAPQLAHGGYIDHDHSICMAHGGYCMAEGGPVPGDAPISGDSRMNDMVPIQASPGEAVIPRSSVAQHPDVVASLLGDQNPGPQIDFQDVGTLLKALRAIRMGAI